jgi:hypothetical protein
LSDSGTIDLTGNDLDIQNGWSAVLATATALIRQGYNNGAWTGTGINSSTAAGDTAHLTALGVVLNTTATTLDGRVVAANDVLVKYTYYGDTNLDGHVDGSDYSRIDNAVLNNSNSSNTQLTGWYNGDFNYDGVINGSDYTLIDNAFNTQGAALTAEVADPSVSIAAEIAAPVSAVPEPACLSLAVVGASLLSRRRRVHCRA